MKKLILLLTCLLAFVFYGSTNTLFKGEPTFNGVVKFPGIVKSNFDTLLVTYDKPYTPWGTKNLFFQIMTDKNGRFNFNLPKYDQPIKMRILVRMHGKWKSLNPCFIEAFDDFKIDIIKGEKEVTAKFYGTGAAKYNITDSLNNISKQWEEKGNEMKLYEPANFKSKLSMFNEMTRQIEQKRSTLIENQD